MASIYGDTPSGLISQIINLAGILTRQGGLKVPRYQRPYTWTEREVRRLIQDLLDAVERSAGFYFIGQIVLVQNKHGEYEISDGQQRLTTLSMIIAYVRDRLPHRAAHYQGLLMDETGQKSRLSVRGEDELFFLGNVLEPGRMAQMALMDETGSDSKNAMVNAARTIGFALRDMRDRQLDELMTFIVRRATFNVVDAFERGCAATVYNTLNDRGQDLSAADNIKCDLLENSNLSDEEATAAARKWEELEDKVGRVRFAKLLNMMPFLLTGEHFMSPGDLGAFRNQVERAGGVRTFLFDKLPGYAAALRDILVGAVDVGSASADVNRRLTMLMQLDQWDWAPAALTFLAEHRKPQHAAAFFRALDCYSFSSAISGEIIHSSRREKRLADAARFAGDINKVLSHEVLGLNGEEQDRLVSRLNSKLKDQLERLVLIRIEAALPGGSILTTDMDVTVEHILPIKGVTPYWETRFPNKERRRLAAGMLGNLTLVTYAQNDAADCKSFPEKLEIYFNTPGAPVHALTKPLKDVKEWTFEEIDGRQDDMIYHLMVDWGLLKKQG